MVYNFKRFSRAGIAGSLRFLKVLKDMRVPVPVEVFANACREVLAGFADIARITACTGKLVNNTRTNRSSTGAGSFTLNMLLILKKEKASLTSSLNQFLSSFSPHSRYR